MSFIKKKLRSKAGASMLLAMVFLMFCLFIGGSVLAAATANGSRVEHLKNDQQDYLSQRSAMLLMADMLTDDNGEELQIVITDVTTAQAATADAAAQSTRIVTFTSPNTIATSTVLQKLLLSSVVTNYSVPDGTTKKYSDLNIGTLSVTTPNSLDGNINITDPNGTELNTKYNLTTDYDLSIEFVFPAESQDSSFFSLSLDASIGEGKEKVVMIGSVTTTTKTTVIRWSEPVIEKRGA